MFATAALSIALLATGEFSVSVDVTVSPADSPAAVVGHPFAEIDRRAQCSASSQTYIDNIVCPTVNDLDKLLNYEADIIGNNVFK